MSESLAARRRRIAAENAARLEDAAAKARPEGTNARGHSQEQQRAYGLEVLLSAYGMALADAEAWRVLAGGRHPRAYVLDAAGGSIAGHYALALLGYLEPRPHGFLETLALLSQGIERAGGTAPQPPKLKHPRRKPGPKVASGPPSPEEVERRRALLASAAAAPQPRPPLVMLAQAGLNCCVVQDEVPRQRLLLMAALEDA